MQLKPIFINIWDDFLEPGNTDLYVEMDPEDLTNLEVLNILDYVTSCLDIYLPSIKYNLRHTDNEFTRLDLNNITHQDIDNIIKVINQKTYKNYKLNVYSES